MERLPLIAGVCGALFAAAGLRNGQTNHPERVVRRGAPVVWIESGTFTMGADGTEIYHAMTLCAREPYTRDPNTAAVCVPFARTLLTGANALCGDIPDDPTHTFDVPSVFEPELGAHRVWLPSFGIDRTEVTVGAYDRCVAVGACRPTAVSLGTPQFGGATQPMVAVSWEEAQSYCHWAGGRLPSEAEWERAARGVDGRTFPWGHQWDGRRANHGAVDPARATLTGGGCYDASDGFALSAPVGSFPDGASPDGLLDMAGNASEWVNDYWDEAEGRGFNASESHYPQDAGAPVVAPRGATHGSGHIVRGGAYDTPAFALRTTFRRAAGTGERSLSIGFRCAYDLH